MRLLAPTVLPGAAHLHRPFHGRPQIWAVDTDPIVVNPFKPNWAIRAEAHRLSMDRIRDGFATLAA
jgi:hypothetical protein